MAMKLDASEARALSKLSAALDKLIEINPTMSLQAAKLFLLIASLPEAEASNTTISKRLDMAQATVSRSLTALSSRTPPKDGGVGGLDLLRIAEDPKDYRRRLWLLTPKGKAAVAAITKALS